MIPHERRQSKCVSPPRRDRAGKPLKGLADRSQFDPSLNCHVSFLGFPWREVDGVKTVLEFAEWEQVYERWQQQFPEPMHGWYSPSMQQVAGYCIYRRADNSRVRTTMINRTPERPNCGWEDLVYQGEVYDCLESHSAPHCASYL